MAGHGSSDAASMAEATQDATSLYDETESWSGMPSAPEASDPLIGTTLHDTYVVDRVLGEGGMGRVYEARHTRLPNKRFAIKVLHAELALNADLQARFQREAETAAAIEHPGVVGIYDVGRTPQGWQYIVCEHLTGIELHRYIKQQGHLSQTTVVHIGRQLCDALDAAHEKAVIHRDLKPHNVFLVGDFRRGVPERPRVKVLDFGLSRFMNGDSQLTKTGVVMGTPGYMAPEQAQGRHADHRTDVYGVGAILYAAATGRPPFLEDTPQRTVLAVMSREPDRPRLVEPSVSEGLELVIQRAMAKEPLLRYRDLKEMSRALAALESGPVPSLMPAPLPLGERSIAPEEGRAARLRFVSTILALTGLAVAFAWTALLGLFSLRSATGKLTTPQIVLLTALVVVAVFVVAIIARRVRRNVWPNSARVVDWLHVLRPPLVAGLAGYGLAAFLVRFGDEVLPTFARGTWFGQGAGVAYRGFSVVLPVIGLITALAAVLHQRWWSSRRALRRWVFGPILTSIVVLTSFGMLYGALGARSGRPFSVPGVRAAAATKATTPAKAAPAEATPSPAAAPTGSEGSTSSQEPATAEVPASAEPSAHPDDANLPIPGDDAPVLDVPAPTAAERAAADELRAATAQGRDGLRALAQRYPKDPDVLKALFLALQAHADTYEEALQLTKTMLEVAPGFSLDRELRFVISRAPERGGRAAEIAFEVLSGHMGRTGGDMLYELLLRKPALELRARQALRAARRLDHVSPALAIAYDLRFSPSCSVRLSLLSRAAEVGDDRAVAVLQSLASRPKGCRRTRNRPCNPPCPAEAQRFLEAAERINQRLKTTKN